MSYKDEILIIGAGLAGLCCARRLHQERIPFTLLDASEAVGGRVRTDIVNGFLLDRGFQIFLTVPHLIRQKWQSLDKDFYFQNRKS